MGEGTEDYLIVLKYGVNHQKDGSKLILMQRHQGSEFIGTRCVARDDRGQFLCARVPTNKGRGYPREAEALSLKEALTWIKEWRTQKLIFETDCKLLVDELQRSRGNLYLLLLWRIVRNY